MHPITILDAYAILAFLEDESGADLVRELLLDAEVGKTQIMMSTVNLGEVWYAVARADSPETADRLILEFQSLAIEIVEANWELTRQAAAFKARGKAPYTDCFAAALAKIHEGKVVTGDREFKEFEDDVEILWL